MRGSQSTNGYSTEEASCTATVVRLTFQNKIHYVSEHEVHVACLREQIFDVLMIARHLDTCKASLLFRLRV